MGETLRILLVEDSPEDANLVRRELDRAGLDAELRVVATRDEFVSSLSAFSPRLVISDFSLPSFDGLAALALARELAPAVPVIVCTGSLDEETAVACMKAGAWDYVLKERIGLLAGAVRRALDLAGARTERTSATERLAESHAILSGLIESSADPIFSVDKDLRYTAFNAAHADVMRSLYGTEIGLGQCILDCQTVDDDRATARRNLERGLAGETVVDEAYSGAAALQRRYFQVVHNPIRAADGASIGVAVFARDLTLQQQAADAVRASERLLRERLTEIEQVYRYAPVGLFVFDREYRFVRINERMAEINGFPVEYHLGRSLDEIVPDLAPGLKAIYRPIFERREPVLDVELHGETPRAPGVKRDWLASYFPLLDDDGKVAGLIGAVLEVTEQKQIELALRRSERQFRELLETINLVGVILDVEGKVVFANDYLLALTGWSGEEVLGRDWFATFLPPDVRVAVRRMFREGVAAGTLPSHFENAVVTRAGEHRQIVWHNTMLRDAAGDIVGTASLGEDVTREAALRQQLNQAQKMEAVGRLAGGIAHDFNNLLQALMSQLELLRSASRGHEGMNRPFVELDQLVRRGASLTRQLLLFSRQETTQPECLELNDIVRHANTLLRRVVRENVAIDLDLAAADLLVTADRGQLDQILMNLVLNASDAMPDGGRVTLRTGGTDGEVWLAVEDTGRGLGPEVLAHLFEPFFTTKVAGQGTGLGLSVVHGIVTAHGGRIEVESPAGGGALFRVVLPRLAIGRLQAPEDLVDEAADPPAGGGEMVLVVEDEQGARQGLAEILSLLGYTVTTAASAEEALEVPREVHVDVVLSDLLLPGLSGPELVVHLRERWPHLKVVLMSGYTDDESVRRAVAGGGVEFLQKPFDMALLAEVMRRVLDAPPSPGEV